MRRSDHSGVACLTFCGPEGNRLDEALIAALDRAVDAALADPSVVALVLQAEGNDFCAGAVADLPPPGPEPTPVPEGLEALDQLCRRIAQSPRPVVVVLHGRVIAGGLALALAAHVRLAAPGTVLHFPEPRLARLPPGGGVVRLAWRLGAAGALAFLRRARPLPAEQAGVLVDGIEGDGLTDTAQALAVELAAVPYEPDFPGLGDGAGFSRAVSEARAVLPRPLPPSRYHEALLLDALEAAQLLPPDAALDFDLNHAQEAATRPQARALAHLARSARRVLDTPEARQMAQPGGQAAPRRTGPLLVCLAPAEAAQVVPPLLRSGAAVYLVAPTPETLGPVLEAVAEVEMAAVSAGRLTQARADSDWERLEGAVLGQLPAHPGLALTQPDAAAALAAEIEADCPLLIWGGMPPAGLPAPAHAVGLVPGPVRQKAGLAQLIEVVVPAGAQAASVERAMELVLALRLTPVRTAGRAILPLMLQAARRAAQALAALGTPPETLADCGLLPAAALRAEPVPAAVPVHLPLPAERLLLLALINAGARLLETGQVLRPCDIDVAMVLGAGYPNWRGGPMAEADGLGPLVLRHELQRAAQLDPDLWSASPIIDELIRLSWRFEDFNRD